VSLPPVSLFFSMLPRPLRSTLFPYTTLFRSDGSVEGRLVLGGRVLVERLGVVVAQVGEQLGAGLDEVDVLAVALLRLVARGAVVCAFRLLAVVDELGVVLEEDVELPRDELCEAR